MARAAAALVLLSLAAALAAALAPARATAQAMRATQAAPTGRITEQVVMVPKAAAPRGTMTGATGGVANGVSNGATGGVTGGATSGPVGTAPRIELETTIFRPPGDGPFPLVVINHGKAPGRPAFQGRARFSAQSAEFLRRGYVVALPMRQGFSKSGGTYVGGDCDVRGNGIKQAEDVIAALDYLVRQPYVDGDRIVVVGQSHGGLSTIALSTIGYPGVRGVINFAGGLRNDNCPAWETSLIDAFGDYGKTARYPSLWIYGDNDSYWPWPMPERMFNSYKANITGAAAVARFVDVGEFESDSHRLFSNRNGIAAWLPEVGAFFRELDLPFDEAPQAPELADPSVPAVRSGPSVRSRRAS